MPRFLDHPDWLPYTVLAHYVVPVPTTDAAHPRARSDERGWESGRPSALDWQKPVPPVVEPPPEFLTVAAAAALLRCDRKALLRRVVAACFKLTPLPAYAFLSVATKIRSGLTVEVVV